MTDKEPLVIEGITITKNLAKWADNFIREAIDETICDVFEELDIENSQGRYLFVYAEGCIIEEITQTNYLNFGRWEYAMGRDNWFSVFDLKEDRERTVSRKFSLDP